MPEENTFKTGEYSALDSLLVGPSHVNIFLGACQLEHLLLAILKFITTHLIFCFFFNISILCGCLYVC